MKKCKCGATNMLMKKGNEWVCLSCFSKTKPVISELDNIIEESVRKRLVYLSGVYKKRLRLLEEKEMCDEQ